METRIRPVKQANGDLVCTFWFSSLSGPFLLKGQLRMRPEEWRSLRQSLRPKALETLALELQEWLDADQDEDLEPDWLKFLSILAHLIRQYNKIAIEGDNL
jgi:hypothetical protein